MRCLYIIETCKMGATKLSLNELLAFKKESNTITRSEYSFNLKIVKGILNDVGYDKDNVIAAYSCITKSNPYPERHDPALVFIIEKFLELDPCLLYQSAYSQTNVKELNLVLGETYEHVIVSSWDHKVEIYIKEGSLSITQPLPDNAEELLMKFLHKQGSFEKKKIC